MQQDNEVAGAREAPATARVHHHINYEPSHYDEEGRPIERPDPFTHHHAAALKGIEHISAVAFVISLVGSSEIGRLNIDSESLGSEVRNLGELLSLLASSVYCNIEEAARAAQEGGA